VKWMHLILECMCIEFFGKSVLPAFSAITGSEARKFMAFLVLVVAGSFQAYWSLPIPENQPRQGVSELWKSFTAVFRLDILDDYDVWELEGVHDQINKSVPGDMYDIDEGPESQLYHDGIQLMGTFLSCFVAVGAMNMSIGVLSKSYDENKARANQIYCHFKAGYTFKFLQRQVFSNNLGSKICGVLCCFCSISDESEGNNIVENPMRPLRGLLIRFQKKTYIDYGGSLSTIEQRLRCLEQNDRRLDEVFQVIKLQLERLTGGDLGRTALARQGTRVSEWSTR